MGRMVGGHIFDFGEPYVPAILRNQISAEALSKVMFFAFDPLAGVTPGYPRNPGGNRTFPWANAESISPKQEHEQKYSLNQKYQLRQPGAGSSGQGAQRGRAYDERGRHVASHGLMTVRRSLRTR